MRDTQRKGDIAVTQAIATFTKIGYDVLLPITESAMYDLVIDRRGELRRVQCKFTSSKTVGLRRIHSNSKGYVVKRYEVDSYDYLYVLKSDGREYLIDRCLDGRNAYNPQDKDLIGKWSGMDEDTGLNPAAG